MTLWCCCAICIPLCREFSALIIVFSHKITMSMSTFTRICHPFLLQLLPFYRRSLNVITTKWKCLYLQPGCVCECVRLCTFHKQRLSHFGNWKWKLKLYKPSNLFGISCLCHCTDLIVQISIYRWFYDWYHRSGASGEVGRCPSIQPALCTGHGREDECIVHSNDMQCPVKLRK